MTQDDETAPYIRARRVRRTNYLNEDIFLNSDVPEPYRGPPIDMSRFDRMRGNLADAGWFAIRPQDNRLTEEERRVLAQITVRLNRQAI